MGDYIALDVLGTPSGSEETLYSASSRSKLHPGYGRRNLPVKQSAASGFGGSQYDHIFQGQLGQAAVQHNYLGFYENRFDYVRKLPTELRNLPPSVGNRLIKPYDKPWNRETKKQFPKHWSLVNPRAGVKKQKENLPPIQEEKDGLVLPFSSNIGPGNSIRPAKNAADLIAQGHDLHYQEAKKDSDVLSADREAISQFAYEAIEGKDPVSRIHAAVGAIGLGVKHAVESLAGKVIYGELCHQNVIDHLVQIPKIDPIGTL